MPPQNSTTVRPPRAFSSQVSDINLGSPDSPTQTAELNQMLRTRYFNYRQIPFHVQIRLRDPDYIRAFFQHQAYIRLNPLPDFDAISLNSSQMSDALSDEELFTPFNRVDRLQ